MKFHHEKLKEDNRLFEDVIQSNKREMKDKSFADITALCWEICDYWESCEIGEANFYKTSVDLFVDRPLTPAQWDEVMSDIDDILIAKAFKLDASRSSSFTTNRWNLVYIQKTFDKIETIRIEIMSNNCERIQTGRLVPEYEVRCGLIEGA